MHWFLTALGSAFVFGLAGFLMKVSQMRGGALSSLLLGLYTAGTLGFWAQALLADSWDPLDWRVWAWGALVGLGSAWGNLLFMRALDYGPASLTSPLTNANILFVVAMGALWYGEPVHPAALAGIVSLVAGVVLLSVKSESSLAIRSNKWYGLVTAATLLFVFRNGGLKVTESLGLDNTSVLWAGYLLSWIWFALAARLERRRAWPAELPRDEAANPERPAAAAAASPARSSRTVGLLWGLAAGVCSYGGLQLYAAALAIGPSHLIAPIFATNSLVVAIGSLLLYRERLTRLQMAALALLLAGLALVRA